jgi:hypothetical protein
MFDELTVRDGKRNKGKVGRFTEKREDDEV